MQRQEGSKRAKKRSAGLDSAVLLQRKQQRDHTSSRPTAFQQQPVPARQGGKAQVRRMFSCDEPYPELLLAMALGFRLACGLLFLTGRVQTLGNPSDKALIIRETGIEDDQTRGGDFIFADIVAMFATAHLDDDQDLAKLAVDTHVPKPDNVIGEKGNRVRTEGEFGERFIHLNRA